MTVFPERISPRSPRVIIAVIVLASLAMLPVIARAAGEPFYISLVARILIFALAACGLNLLLGYGGLVSFGHALYVGLGAYIVGILAASGIENGWIHLAAVIVTCAIIAVVTGAISLRTSGMAFIMITLAFGQMFYFLGISLKQYGGDDGLQIIERSNLWPLSIQTNTGLYYVAYGFLLLTLYMLWRVVHARFGRVLRASKSNAPRMRVLGFPVFRYQLTGFVISGCICGIAGFLLANLTNFTSPAYMFWTVSGDLIVMVMLGGVATILGPVIGAALLIVLETVLAAYTQHWMVFLGPIIVLIALAARRGVYGYLVR